MTENKKNKKKTTPSPPPGAELWRLFVAIETDPVVKDGLEAAIEGLEMRGVRAKWCRRDRFHLTLRFLGHVEVPRIGEVKEALGRAAEGFSPIDFTVEGLGAFPNARRPRVIWAGVKEPEAGRMAALARRIGKELKGLGIHGDDKPFKPHLTLGRVKDPAGARGLAEALEKMETPSFGGERTARSVKLFRSELRPAGAVYTVLKEIPFEGFVKIDDRVEPLA